MRKNCIFSSRYVSVHSFTTHYVRTASKPISRGNCVSMNASTARQIHAIASTAPWITTTTDPHSNFFQRRKHTLIMQYLRHYNIRDTEFDEEADRESPILDSFYEVDGNEGVLKTNFTFDELCDLYGRIQEYIVSNWNVGRARA